MRTFLGCCGSLIALAAATPALADDAPASAITINGTAAVVTDYRFRGLSQTDKDFAVQGSITVSHASGFYASVWGSSIDDYVAAGGDQEIDLIGGYKHSFGGTTLDGGVLYYFYPGAQKYAPSYNSDFFEPYISLSHTLGPVTAKATLNYAPKQHALAFAHSRDDNLYGALDLSGSFMGFGLSGHLGHNFERSYLSVGKRYTDWGLGVSYTYKAITFGVNYVDTDLPKYYATSFPKGKDIAKAGVVGSISVAF